MDEPFRRFEWYVHPAYHWQDWLDERGRPVVIRSQGLMGLDSMSAVEYTWSAFERKKQKCGPVLGPVEGGGAPRAYSPMSREHAAMFRMFADLDYTDLTAISGFVARYGLLGIPPQSQAFTVPARSGPGRFHYAWGESHLDWAREICLMREALDLARSRTPAEEAQDRAAWKRVGLEPPYEERRVKLAWLFNVHLQQVQARMSLEADTPPRLSFAPLSLLAAMWLQLALSVVGDKEFRACKLCHRLFEISTEQTGFRSHRAFCSESCKTKDYRKRKGAALKLMAQGKPMAFIAKQTDTSRDTVRAWVEANLGRAKGKK